MFEAAEHLIEHHTSLSTYIAYAPMLAELFIVAGRKYDRRRSKTATFSEVRQASLSDRSGHCSDFDARIHFRE
jgi:hypothetical protein